MPLLRLIAEGVGPFERLDLDFSDGHGNPHLGPHILAGVNGSGKSTALRAIAWVLDQGKCGVNYDEWRHFLLDHAEPRALLVLRSPAGELFGLACFPARKTRDSAGLVEWARTAGAPDFLFGAEVRDATQTTQGLWVHLGDRLSKGFLEIPGAYAPSRSLKHLDRPDRAEPTAYAFKNCLAFESTVDNEGIQAWLFSLHTRAAFAKARGQPAGSYEEQLRRFESALSQVCDRPIRSDVDHEPQLKLYLHAFGEKLNFSQLPDGVRNTTGWLADFMMRQDLMQWDPALKGKRPGILLLDEVDAHLHPRWQRTLLPAMRAALPDVQIIVTSHSPFVISSCKGARVHVLDLQNGRASLVRSSDVPFGESVTATLREIFGVSSRFDVDTEKKLEEWNELSRQAATGPLSRADRQRLEKLTADLAGRSEELRSIVGPPRATPLARNACPKSPRRPRGAAH